MCAQNAVRNQQGSNRIYQISISTDSTLISLECSMDRKRKRYQSVNSMGYNVTEITNNVFGTTAVSLIWRVHYTSTYATVDDILDRGTSESVSMPQQPLYDTILANIICDTNAHKSSRPLKRST